MYTYICMKAVLLILSLIVQASLVQAAETNKPVKRANHRGYKVMAIPKGFNEIKNEINKENEVYVPKSVSQNDSVGTVGAKFGDQIIQNWLNSEAGS
ncbi:MAG: hypothetical protein V4736_01375, partial [Bdellovibrionota bacterium]